MSERYQNRETTTPELTLADVVRQKIAEIEPKIDKGDPYTRRLGGIAVRPPFDTSESSDGRLEFGDKYETRTLSLDGFEIMYVANKDVQKRAVSIIVHQFSPHGGLAKRLWFGNRYGFGIADSGFYEVGMKKEYQLPPWAIESHHGGYLHATLEEDEAQRILGVLSDPLERSDELERLFELSEAEQVALSANQEEYRRSQAKFREQLRAIDEAQRVPFDAEDVFFAG